MINVKTQCKKILVVVDYQKGFVNGTLGIPGSEKLADFIQSRIDSDDYSDIIYTFDTHEADVYKDSEEAKMFPLHNEYKTPDWEFYNIHPRIGKTLFNQAISHFNEPFKIISISHIENDGTYDIFMTKDVFNMWDTEIDGIKYIADDIKKRYNPENVEFEIVGLAENYCVFQAAMGFLSNGYKTTILSDGVMAIPDDSEAKSKTVMKNRGVIYK